jgi:sec-independent protein translocase protein TatC
MSTDDDLFNEEQSMVTMSFGEHIEELRVRLILALLGLFVGVIVVFIPPLDIGWRVMKKMEEPAKVELDRFYKAEYAKKTEQAEKTQSLSPTVEALVDAEAFFSELNKYAPELRLPQGEAIRGKTLNVPMRFFEAGLIQANRGTVVQIDQSLVSLAPLETLTIYFVLCLVVGLVIASPWVFYQAWAFVAAGLYRHERRYVKKYLPYSLGLFLTGVFLCFFFVLPLTLQFLLKFNVWLGVAPTLRLSDWMGFASILPLIFGISFQTPLIMLFLERIGILSVDDFRAKRKIAILVITIAAAVLTPGQDPISMLLLAIPMVLLYEIGIVLIGSSGRKGSVLRPEG